MRDLEMMAEKLRAHSLRATSAAGSGHPTSCLSCAEIMSCLFFSELKKEDAFILSKGHAAPILWAAFAEAGLIDARELMNLRKFHSRLEGHPTFRFPGINVATGSLGQGLAAGVGMALAKRLSKETGKVYVLMGDGECAEGSVWEAAALATHYHLKELCAIVDINRLGQSQETLHGHDVEAYRKKFEGFGWECKVVEGNHVHDLLDVFEQARKSKGPFVILAKTKKGKGVSFLENKEGWHGKSLTSQELAKALQEIHETPIHLQSQFHLPSSSPVLASRIGVSSYALGQKVATRDAFGDALVSLGKKSKNIVVIDGDVKNSTKTESFFVHFPERSFEAFIAEQAMVGMALGFSAQGYLPFAATFSAFLTRAHDFIRMASYSKANIKIVGSHAGVHIGEDGPSQMGLEDLSMFLSIPESLILYPSDGVSAWRLTEAVANHRGISYLKTTRAGLSVLYKNTEKFPVGKFKILRKSSQDKVLIVGAGVTLHEALKAHALLKEKHISSRVLDLYSVRPLDAKLFLKELKACKNKVIVVEDHYFNGIGSVISEILASSKERFVYRHLYVKEIPRSGKPEELLRAYHIDAKSIVKEVGKMVRN